MCAHSIKSIFDIWMSEDTREDTFLFRIGYAKWSSSFAIFLHTYTYSGLNLSTTCQKKSFWNFASVVWKVEMQKRLFWRFEELWFFHEFVWERMESYLQDKWGGKLKHDILKRKWKLIHFPIQAARIQEEIQ